MKRLINILILIFGISFIFIATSGYVKLNCLFKSIFDISCPGCGLTRSFRSILNFDLYNAFKYNILGIPLFILCIVTIISLIIDIIRGKDTTIKFYFNIFSRYYIGIIIILVVTMIINNINGI